MIVSGESTSRLSELEKYVVTTNFSEKYKLSGSVNVDGVNLTASNVSSYPKRIVYYVGGIAYTDFQETPDAPWRTIYNFEGQGYNSPDFIEYPTYKDPNKEKIFANPKIENDVFIDREEESAYKDNFILEYIGNLIELETYAGGNYFNIVNNS